MTAPTVRADGARVLADLTALRHIGAYKTGVHRPSYSPEHLESLRWLMQRMPEAGLTPALDGIGNVIGTSTRTGPSCSRDHILKARTMLGGSTGLWALSMRSKPRAS